MSLPTTRQAVLAQQAAHLEAIRDPLRVPRGFRNGLLISAFMWAVVGLVIAQVLS